MKVSKNNIWLRLYRYAIDPVEDPKSLCPLFWGGLLGLVDVIIFLPVSIINIWMKVTGMIFHFLQFFIVTVLFVSSLGLGTAVLSSFINTESPSALQVLLILIVGLIGIGIIIALVALLTQIPIFIKNYFQKRNKNEGGKENNPSVIVQGIKSVKNKVCPIIEYVD